jgi:thiol-disulfide isomerase/thioredoxin
MKKLLYFRADWCGPCRQMSAVISDVFETWEPAKDYSLERVDIDAQPELAARMGIRGIPTMIILDESGAEQSRRVGVMFKNKFQEWLADSFMATAIAKSSSNADRDFAVVSGEYSELKEHKKGNNMLINWFKNKANDLSKPALPSRVEPIILGYTPINWNKTKDPHTGLYTYQDNRLNILQDNLTVMSQMIVDLRVNSKIDILEIQRNLEAQTIKNPTIERMGWVMAKMVECIALAFPAGKPAAVVAGLLCRLASGGLQYATRANTDNPDYQQAVNDLRNSVDTWFSDLEDQISDWIQDMESNWSKVYKDQYGNSIRLCDIADHDELLPHKGIEKEYNTWFNDLSALVKTEMTKQLLPVRYRKRHAGFSFNEDETQYNAYWFWNVSWIEVRNSSTWDAWRGNSNWPRIPDNLRDSLEGPHEDIGNWEDYKGGRQYYQSINNEGKVVLNAARWDNGQYWWTRMSNSRWMYWGGRHCKNWDAHSQDPGCDSRIDSQGNVIQGTPFLDFVDDVANNENGFSYCKDRGDSVLMYYELKDPRTGQLLRNSRRQDLMTSTAGCKDYFYQINWFKWNWCYVGIQLRFYILVDDHGNRINDATARWLFKDNGHGKITNAKGIANRLDVYFDWGLSEG